MACMHLFSIGFDRDRQREGRKKSEGGRGWGEIRLEFQREAQIQLISQDTLPPEEAQLCTCTV